MLRRNLLFCEPQGRGDAETRRHGDAGSIAASPRLRVPAPLLWGAGAGLLALLLGLTLAARGGLITVAIERPDGHWFWYFSRTAGVTAYLALALTVLWGLLASTAVGDGLVARARCVDLHRWLSAVGLALAAAHAILLVGDGYVQFDALDVLVPFVAPYRPVAVGLGVVAAYLALVVYGSLWLRGWLGQRGWRAVHFLSFPAFGLATLHGLLAGTDGGALWLRALYLLAAGLVLWLSCYRALSVLSAES
ncbi:MAG: hypothetical protein HY690_03615 [Chloroflexi bacterium]|nr:hypothetical protein [Chloroflexota bacterium]